MCASCDTWVARRATPGFKPRKPRFRRIRRH